MAKTGKVYFANVRVESEDSTPSLPDYLGRVIVDVHAKNRDDAESHIRKSMGKIQAKLSGHYIGSNTQLKFSGAVYESPHSVADLGLKKLAAVSI